MYRRDSREELYSSGEVSVEEHISQREREPDGQEEKQFQGISGIGGEVLKEC